MSASRLRVSLMTCLLLLSVMADVASARSKPVGVMADLNESVPRHLEQDSVPGAAVALIRQGKVQTT
jgi:hypothetical protein